VVGIPEVQFGNRGTREGGKAELMSGKVYLFLTGILFSPRKSLHGLSDPSFIFSKKNPASTGEEDDESCSQRVLDVPLYGLLLGTREVKHPATGYTF
jgi:hypothetical protein